MLPKTIACIVAMSLLPIAVLIFCVALPHLFPGSLLLSGIAAVLAGLPLFKTISPVMEKSAQQ